MPVAALTQAPAKAAPDSSRSKLTIGAVHDPLEFEADAIADRVMRGYGAPPATASASQTIRRKCACEGSGQPSSKCEQEERQSLLRKAVGSDSATHTEAPPIVRDVLRSPGQPLDRSTRSFMESRFGYDLSHVRIHADSRAARSAESVNAEAYTVGRNVVFGAGQYNPASEARRRLLAHEIAHVVQQSGATGSGTLVQRKKKEGVRVASCGLLNLAGSITDIGSLAHIQIQAFLAAKAVLPEFEIPRASKSGFRVFNTGCQSLATPFGFADLAQRNGAGFDLGEIKPVTFGGPARAKLEARHYQRRARQSMQRVFKIPGSCARRTAGPDDVGFAAVNALSPVSNFSLLGGVLTGDQTIGPFDGDPSLTLKAKEVGPGAVCYWCTKGGGQDDKKEEPKPPGPSVGLGVSVGGSAGGAYNAGIGVAIMSDSTAYGTAGAGVSYKSDSKAAGAAGVGVSVESDAIAAGAAAAGATQNSQSVGAGVAGAGTSKDSVSAAAGVASKGSVQDSATAGAGVASKGEVKDSMVAGAGVTGSGKLEGVTGAGTGSPGKPVEAKDVQGGGKSATPAQEGAGSKDSAGKDGAGKDSAGKDGAGSADAGAGSGGASAPSKDASESAAAKGAQAAKEAGPDAGGGGSDAGPEAAKDGGGGSAGSGGGAAKAGSGLGVVPLAGPTASEADRGKAAEEASKVAALLANASPAQVALFRYLAHSSPNGQYVVPASQWVQTMVDATAGLSEEDIGYLKSLDWKPSSITPEELRKRIDELLKTKRPAASGDSASAGAGDKDKDKAQGKGALGSGKGPQSGGGGKGKDGSSTPELVTPRKYTGQLESVNETVQIQADDRITTKTTKGTKVNLEVRWREGATVKRARIQYEVVGDPESLTDPKTGKKMLRFDLRSTNTDPLELSPPGAEKPTVLPAGAPGSYLIILGSRK